MLLDFSMSDARDINGYLENSRKIKKSIKTIIGGSSGGHLAASLVMVPYDDNKIIENIRALIFFNPTLNTTFLIADLSYQKILVKEERNSGFFKKLFEGRSIELSPSSYVRENLPLQLSFMALMIGQYLFQ